MLFLEFKISLPINYCAINPTTTVDIDVVKNLLTQPSREQFNSYSKSTPDELKPKKN
jgi:hypothetical protein